MSDQWPACPKCDQTAGAGGRRKFNPTPHYLIATVFASIGGLIYGAQFVGHMIDPTTMRFALVLIVVGVSWYGATRVLALFR